MAGLTGLVNEDRFIRIGQVINRAHRSRMAVGKRLLDVIGPILTDVHREQVPSAFGAHIKQRVQQRHFAKGLVAADGRMPSTPPPGVHVFALLGGNAGQGAIECCRHLRGAARSTTPKSVRALQDARPRRTKVALAL